MLARLKTASATESLACEVPRGTERKSCVAKAGRKISSSVEFSGGRAAGIVGRK